jgi:transposase
LHRARRALLKDRTAAKNRAKILRVMLLKGHNDQRLTQIDEQIGAIDRAIDILIAEDKDRARRLDILTSIPGIATATAVALIIEMPELGTLEGKQAASLAGLAPITRQSGTWTGRAHIRGGRARLRQALYMPALVACRFNPDLKAKYDQLTTAGKPPKIAITAVMRKLLLLANALLRDDRKWNQSLA